MLVIPVTIITINIIINIITNNITNIIPSISLGIGMGKTCEPKAFSFQCMTKFTTKKKKNEL